ncbi:hypothetical protein PG993_002485 [Apiospora rasikravindrae]|uniref:Knr4/Smi1-like domain-containing protein n=1 Tax=Apiospora rasikravindrae TaxID=990691 RepID=A0ABR1TWT5_9PEZI
MASPGFRSAVASGLAQFYDKLTKAAYLPPDAIQHPPPEGWTDAEMDLQGIRTTLGRSDAVVDLLRHLPYLRPVDTGPQTGQWPVFPKTKAMRYLCDGSSLDHELEGLYELAHLPPDMVSLTHPAGEYTHYGPQWWLVDCSTGRITKYAGPPRGEDLADEFAAEWRKAPTYTPADLFQEVTAMLGKDYYFVPGLVDGIEAEFCTPDRREYSSVYQAYMLAGWQHGLGPGPDFDREKCRNNLERSLKQRQKLASRKRKADAARHETQPRPVQRKDPATYPAGYDRDVIVAGLTRYYETLAKMAFFPASVIQRPPGGRWDDAAFLPAATTRLLGFNDTVVDLLRHLPYLDADEAHDDNRWPVAGRAEPQRYLADNPELDEALAKEPAAPGRLCAHGILPFEERMPAGLVPIAGSDGGVWWLVDTDAGTVTVYDPGNRQVRDAPDDQPWRWNPPRAAGPFFDGLVDGLYALDLVPVPRPDTDVSECYPEIWGAVREEGEDECEDELPDPEIEDARDIYRAHGWPDLAQFRHQECYDALVEFRTKLLEEDSEEDYGPA